MKTARVLTLRCLGVLFLLTAAPLCTLLATPAGAQGGGITVTVTTTQDGGPGSLRQAILDTNAHPGADTVIVPAGLYPLDLGQELAITDDLTVQGAGADRVVIDGLSRTRVFNIDPFANTDLPPVVVDLSGVTLRGGNAGVGAGIENRGDLSVTDSVVTGSFASGLGGGIGSDLGRPLTLTRVTVSGDLATEGGGVFTNGPLTMTNCTVSGNAAQPLNGSGDGGGIAFAGPSATLTNCTIAGNSAYGDGSGIFNGGGAMTLKNTLLHNSPSRNPNSTTGGNCGGSALTSAGHNLSGDATCEGSFTAPGDLNNVNPRLAPVSNYGGPVPTQALLAGSPAIDAGDNRGAPATDERGVSRPQGAAVDIGAFEFEPDPNGTLQVTTTADGVPGSLREAIRFANARAGADTILLPAGTYSLSLPGPGEDANRTGDLDVLDDLTLKGADASTTIIEVKGLDRVFDVVSGIQPGKTVDPAALVSVTISGVTIRGGIAPDGIGGGIRTRGALALSAAVLSSNSAPIPTGGDFAEGGGVAFLRHPGSFFNLPVPPRSVLGGAFTGNASEGDGGGIAADVTSEGRTLPVTGTSFSGNTAAGAGGGGVTEGGTLLLTNCSFDGNTSGLEGGGFSNEGGPSTLTGCTFTNNTANNDARGRAGGGGGFVNAGGDLVATGCTFTGNRAGDDGGGGFENQGGSLQMSDCLVSNNAMTGSDGGGGFENEGGTLVMTRCVISGNTATLTRGSDGGGGFENEGGTLVMTDCTVSGNSVNTGGGGVLNEGGGATLTGCTISGNTAGTDGGGLEQEDGSVTITNCTVSGNSAAASGGGIGHPGGGTLLNVTINGNRAATGGGIFYRGRANPPLSLKNTIVAGSPTGGNFAQDTSNSNPVPPVSAGHNLSSDNSLAQVFTASGDRNNTDPRLGPLADNGGLTRTHALLSGSPAIDAGDNAGAPGTDQRGVSRPQDGDGNGTAVVDIGAFELAPPSGPTLTNCRVSPRSLPAAGGDVSISVDVNAPGGKTTVTATITPPGGKPGTVSLTRTGPKSSTYRGSFAAAANASSAVQTYTVRVSADDGGGGSASADCGTFTVAAPGAGRVRITPGSLDFGMIRVGLGGRKKIRVRNTGTGTLTGTVGAPGTPFTLLGSQAKGVSFSLDAGESLVVMVQFAPTARRRFTGSLPIDTSDPAHTRLNVPLRGQGCGRE